MGSAVGRGYRDEKLAARHDADYGSAGFCAWGTISSLVQQMGTAESGLASAKYRAEVEAELEQMTEDDGTCDLLRVLILNRKK